MRRTSEGFLLDLTDWDESVASMIASEMSLDLTEAHWHIVHFVRAFYLEYHTTPTMRALIKAMQAELPNTPINSLYIQSLFPDGAAKQIAKIAGLPKPTKCI